MDPKLIITAVIVAAAIYIGTQNMSGAPTTPSHEAHSSHTGPAIGGEFALTDTEGKPYTQENLKGQYSLVFFGFSNCPDMCPTALSTITAALDTMRDESAEKITPILITVDPERDTPEALKAYKANFHPRMVALTGTQEQVDQAASAFKVYHQKSDPKTEDYMVNHSGYIYMMNPEGEFIKFFRHTVAADTLAIELEQIVH
jgi:cytochrome oxidase Cu insertion factor (SCO1/SenC/PrrC family)